MMKVPSQLRKIFKVRAAGWTLTTIIISRLRHLLLRIELHVGSASGHDERNTGLFSNWLYELS